MTLTVRTADQQQVAPYPVLLERAAALRRARVLLAPRSPGAPPSVRAPRAPFRIKALTKEGPQPPEQESSRRRVSGSWLGTPGKSEFQVRSADVHPRGLECELELQLCPIKVCGHLLASPCHSLFRSAGVLGKAASSSSHSSDVAAGSETWHAWCTDHQGIRARGVALGAHNRFRQALERKRGVTYRASKQWSAHKIAHLERALVRGAMTFSVRRSSTFTASMACGL